LRRYIDVEEAVLFPPFETQAQMSTASPTERMRTEHHQIRGVLDQLDKLRTTADCSTILQMFDRLVALMTLFRNHCRREEATLYPLMDIVFALDEERELLSLLQVFEI
jgi:hemerythrin-like domain-containing protein